MTTKKSLKITENQKLLLRRLKIESHNNDKQKS